MAKINFTQNKAFGQFVFNAQDKSDRPAGELYKSVQFLPENATGEFKIVDINSFYWQRGYFNAALDVFFRSYELMDGLHLYVPSNPKHLANSFGWIRRDKLALPANGSPLINTTLVVKGKVYQLELPHRKLNGKAAVNVNTIWLSVAQMSDSVLKASNSRIDAASGQDFGVIKHEAMNMIARGVAVTVPVTLQTYFGAKNADGSAVLMDGMQNKAKWAKDLVDMAAEDFAVAQRLFWDTKASIAGNADTRKAVQKMDAANGGRPSADEINAQKAAMQILVKKLDGSTVTVGESELTGFYRVVGLQNGKPNEKVVKQYMFDANRTSPTNIYRLNNGAVCFVELPQNRKG